MKKIQILRVATTGRTGSLVRGIVWEENKDKKENKRDSAPKKQEKILCGPLWESNQEVVGKKKNTKPKIVFSDGKRKHSKQKSLAERGEKRGRLLKSHATMPPTGKKES